ncbi:transposase [Catenibacterium mitsuokai]|uniref:transposase n=1 Tax=Catenibacterium mitsuokai TaxID=100886 RepID=UPI003F8CEDBE
MRCIKGIDTTAAMTMHAETSDFDRFPTANAFASYCGLTPGEDSSGESYHRLSIT